MAKKYKATLPTNIRLLKTYHKLVKTKRIKKYKRLKSLLIVRPVRSLSGIVNVSLLTKPYPCPGKCIYCPTQAGVPKSYLDNEPAVMRAILTKYDPGLQIKTRIEALKANGHHTEKIELRIIGATWSFYPKTYQTSFIKRCFDAVNNKKSKNLEEAQKLNEKAKHRIVGLCVETRPDFIDEKEIKRMRKLGITRVELGVQSIYDDVLKFNKRGHKIESTISATKLLKDAGFKVGYQMMPNLPKSTIKKDEKMFKQLFVSSEFKPDLLKIYPTALLKQAPLYRLWKKKQYKPYTKKELINLLKKAKLSVPNFVRIQRIIRDIPAQSIVTGPAKISNMRQILKKELKKEGLKCKCIRCREIRDSYNPKEKIKMFRFDYNASEGKEIFLTFENEKQERLYSLLRLRIPSQFFTKEKHFMPVLQNSTIIREIHTYGQQLPLKQKGFSAQHKGLGKKLMKEAERITKKEFGLNKIAVISSVGTREYFRKFGYKLKDEYMIKALS